MSQVSAVVASIMLTEVIDGLSQMVRDAQAEAEKISNTRISRTSWWRPNPKFKSQEYSRINFLQNKVTAVAALFSIIGVLSVQNSSSQELARVQQAYEQLKSLT